MKTLKKVILLLLAVTLMLSGLAFAEAARPTEDRAGNPISLPAEITKIVSLAPSTSRIIEALGEMDKVIVVDTYTPLYVAGADALPQFDMMTPDAEQLAALQPDVIFVSGMSYINDDSPFKALMDMGICVVEIPSSDSIASVEEDILFVARCLGKEAEGQSIVDEMQQKIDAIAAIGATITEKKSVLFEIAALPYIYSFGKGTFLNEMIEMIGATNVLADQNSWVEVSEEAAIAANPDVILTSVDYLADAVGEIKGRAGWDVVSAVKNGEVYFIDNAASSLPDQHIVDAMLQMAKAIYPEAYEGME